MFSPLAITIGADFLYKHTEHSRQISSAFEECSLAGYLAIECMRDN